MYNYLLQISMSVKIAPFVIRMQLVGIQLEVTFVNATLDLGEMERKYAHVCVRVN